MSSTTPGPWGLRGHQIRANEGRGATVATYAISRADGILLAAAPELVAALERVLLSAPPLPPATNDESLGLREFRAAHAYGTKILALARGEDLRPNDCTAIWRAGILKSIGSPPDGARCVLEKNHAGDHDFQIRRESDDE